MTPRCLHGYRTKLSYVCFLFDLWYMLCPTVIKLFESRVLEP
nr:MAG TPA: hypothetical protein [Microviridae sp.]